MFGILACLLVAELMFGQSAAHKPDPACLEAPELTPRCLTSPRFKGVRKWYFDKKHHYCKSFFYFGCGGSSNRVDSEEVCTIVCMVQPAEPQMDQPGKADDDADSPTGYDKCRFEPENLEGRAVPTLDRQRFYWDDRMQRCLAFQPSPADGENAGFEREMDCHSICQPSESIHRERCP